MGRRTRWLLWAAVGLGTLLLLTAAIGLLMLSRWDAAAGQKWAESFESMDALVARHPVVPDSPAALELERLARRLDIAFRNGDPGAGPPQAVSAFVRSFAGQPATVAPATERVPDEVAAFLAERRADIVAVRDHLLAEAPIVWTQDVRMLGDDRLNLAGHRDLAEILLADTVDAVSGGDDDRALRSIEAARRLARLFAQRPDLMSQLLAMSVQLRHSGVARRLPVMARDAQDNPPGHDWKAAILTAFQVETLQTSEAVRRNGIAPMSRSDGARNLSVAAIWLRFSLAGHSHQMVRLANHLRGQDPCAIDAEAETKRVQGQLSRLNLVAKVATPGLIRAWVSAGLTAVDDELTRLVRLAQATTTRGESRLPPTLPSSACAGLTWSITTQHDGDILIAGNADAFRDSRRIPSFLVRAR